MRQRLKQGWLANNHGCNTRIRRLTFALLLESELVDFEGSWSLMSQTLVHDL
jgi:hypothetical protein